MSKFDLDDPLGDLLSDGSDDSFFDNPKPLAKTASTAKSPEKKSVSDLFGLGDTKNAERRNVEDDWLGLESKKSIPSPSPAPARAKPVKKISFEDDDDILGNLGLDNKTKTDKDKIETKTTEAKKSSLIESILGPQKTKDKDDKKFLSLDDLLQESKAKKQEMPPTITQSASQLPTEKPFGMGSLEVGSREGRRGRPRTANPDPLGLLQSKQEPDESKVTPVPRRRDPTPPKEIPTEVILPPPKNTSGDVPDWLGGSHLVQKPTLPSALKTTSAPNITTEVSNPVLVAPSQVAPSAPSAPQGIESVSLDNILTQQKLASSHIEYQNTAIALQQQESQLLMALLLKKYEDNMGDLQRKQQEVLVKQEQHFNTLLDKQFAKQAIMENNMRLQQERINNHIQMLISQPQITSVSTEELSKLDESKKSSDEMAKHYEDIIVHLKQRQHEEIFLLEESYKKQISTLEQSMESVENHLKMELDATVLKNREKVDALEEEYKKEIVKYQKKIEELYGLHELEMRQMRENNNRVVEEVKYEYNTIIENLKSSKNLESSVLSDAQTYSAKLDTSLKLLDINSRSILDIREKVYGEYNVLSQAREETIKAKEHEIEAMRVALEKSREMADQERAQLMSLVRNLEIKLAEHSHNSREERLALQQAAATLSARSSALDREAEFNRQSLERERKQLQVLRDTILAEQERTMQELTEEKLQLHSEKVRIETASKLSTNYDALRAKAEVDAAIQVAKEAAEMTDKERENLMRQVREVESQKRTLQDREARLRNQERDLEVVVEQINRKSMLGEKALEDARMLQMNYNDKLREIQAQIASINMRERKLAQDKIAISKERLALHSNARQLKKCGLCAVENNQINEDQESILSEAVEHDIPAFISVSDADMFRLQLQMSEDQLTANHDHDDKLNILR